MTTAEQRAFVLYNYIAGHDDEEPAMEDDGIEAIELQIRAAETEAHNKAVEACAQVARDLQNIADAMKSYQNRLDYCLSMGDLIWNKIKALKREQ